jgi:CheY-like chemotaxis protein
LRLLRADPGLREVPVVAVTAFSMPVDRTNVLAAGFNSYLSKPIEPETFVAQIESQLAPNLRCGLPPRPP